MIRFLPDTLREALLRPLAMAAPNGWAYIEISAPDFRFALALVLALVSVITFFFQRHGKQATAPTEGKLLWALFLLIFAAFVPWLMTTGNGRYFMPVLLLIGPVCIGLICRLPVTKGMKGAMALIVFSIQAVALMANNPWRPFDSWSWIPWIEAPYFSVDIDPDTLDSSATYVTIAGMSMSLVAPLFPDSSRWINISGIGGLDLENPAYRPVRKMLEEARPLKLFHRTQPREVLTGTNQPTPTAVASINNALRPHHMALKAPTDCKFLASASLRNITLIAKNVPEEDKDDLLHKAGFWICSLNFPVNFPPTERPSIEEGIAKRAFERMEGLCPRFFNQGAVTGWHPAGYLRTYVASDSMLIVTRTGEIYLKYERALNPQRIASVAEIMTQGFRVDCNGFKGRAGLPWEREI
jgi:hypothetical protein